MRGQLSARVSLQLRTAAIGGALCLLLGACASSPAPATSAAAQTSASAAPGGAVTPPLALAGIAALPVVVLPEYRFSVAPQLGWSAAVGAPSDAALSLDAEIRSAVQSRGVRAWIFSDALDADFRRNPTYAADPHALAEESLRSAKLHDGDRLPEPLASQLRTMVALRDQARLVLAPVDLRIEPSTGGGQAHMRLVLIDARTSEIKWIGAVRSDPAATYGPAVLASLGARVADLVAAP